MCIKKPRALAGLPRGAASAADLGGRPVRLTTGGRCGWRHVAGPGVRTAYKALLRNAALTAPYKSPTGANDKKERFREVGWTDEANRDMPRKPRS